MHETPTHKRTSNYYAHIPQIFIGVAQSIYILKSHCYWVGFGLYKIKVSLSVGVSQQNFFIIYTLLLRKPRRDSKADTSWGEITSFKKMPSL